MKPIIRTLTMLPGDQVVADSGSSERCFHTGCFDVGKLMTHHAEHANVGSVLTESEPGFSIRSIDIKCLECRRTFTREPWRFLHSISDVNKTNDPKAYLWVRIDKQDPFLEELHKLHPSRAETVRIELKALSTKRDEFANYGPKRRLLASLRGWRAKWDAGRPGADADTGSNRGQQGLPGSVASEPVVTHEPNDRREPPAKPATKPRTSVAFAAPSFVGGNSTPPLKRDPINLNYGGHYNVGAMCFKRNTDSHGLFLGTAFDGMPSQFPDQRIRIEDVLSSDDEKRKNSPLAQQCDGETLRYFHFPANNMRWIEVRKLATAAV